MGWWGGDSAEHFERTVLKAQWRMNWTDISQDRRGTRSWEATAAVQARGDQNLDSSRDSEEEMRMA